MDVIEIEVLHFNWAIDRSRLVKRQLLEHMARHLNIEWRLCTFIDSLQEWVQRCYNRLNCLVASLFVMIVVLFDRVKEVRQHSKILDPLACLLGLFAVKHLKQ